MALEIFDMEQGSDAWIQARLGLPTMSEASTILAKGEGKVRRTYLMKLAGERLTGTPMDNYTNGHFDRGKIMEAEARDLYAFARDADLTQVGFIKNGNKGASPDALIGDDGALEIKTALPHLMVELLLRDEFPPQHKAQCQGVLWVAEREWIDIAVYWPGLPTLIKRAHRDEPYIATLAAEVDRFNAELAELVARVQRYGVAA